MIDDPKVLIANPEYTYDDISDVAEVVVGNPPSEGRNTEEELIELVDGVHAILISSREQISRRVIEAADELQVIMKYGAAPDRAKVDYEAATKHDVYIGYTHGANADSVAEFAVLQMLALYRRLTKITRHLEEGNWRDSSLRGSELKGKTVGIVGYGLVGRKVSEKLSGFDVEFLLFDPYVENNEMESRGEPVDNLETLLKSADIVTIHCMLTDETRQLIGPEELAMMKSSAILVNTARGPIIDQTALHKALSDGKIRGAGIDVFLTEPPESDNPLIDLPTVLATPHMAGVTSEAAQRERDLAHGSVLRVLDGDSPQWIANAEVTDN